MIQLFPNENILTQSTDGMVVLTTHRILYEYRGLGSSHNQSIMLENITSCENRYTTQVWLLIIGGLAFLLGLFGAIDNRVDIFGLGTLFSIICVTVYWLTKINSIIISSANTKILIKANGMSREKVLEFISKVEQAKNRRILILQGK